MNTIPPNNDGLRNVALDNRLELEQYNAEIEEAMKRMDAGEFYTHDQVKEISKGWLNGNYGILPCNECK